MEVADRDRQLAEKASERAAAGVAEGEAVIAGLRAEVAERDRQLAEKADVIAQTSDELAGRDRQLARPRSAYVERV